MPITIISDIDDVVRDFRVNVVDSMNLFYQGEDWGEYYYKNEKIRMFFDWYRKKPYFHNIYKHSVKNTEIVNFYKKLTRNLNINFIFLSSNSDTEGQKLTTEFICKTFGKKYSDKVYYVNRWYDKITDVIKNPKKYDENFNNILFIDDRPDSCIQFYDENIKTFWYTKYLSESCYKSWVESNNKYLNLEQGNVAELKKYVFEIIN